MSDSLTIVVISDLHCRAATTDSLGTTRLHSDQARKPELKHPVSALKKFIRENNLKADVILCPGDITDKADDQGFLSGWDYLKDIKSAFSAKLLLATLGNHDVGSRTSKPFEFAKDLDLDFPFSLSQANTDFWANNFSVIEEDDALFLIFNSSYSHTNSEDSKKCVITDSILEAMENKLASTNKKKKYKVAMCHHHPTNFFNMDYPDTDFIDRGELFIKLLNKYDFQILVHGHKHNARLAVQQGLPVLASGSFSSLENLHAVGADNIFHIIKLESAIRRAVIHSYTYKPMRGWKSERDANFPYLTGFGSNKDANQLAAECAAWFDSLAVQYIRYEEVAANLIDLKYLYPDQQTKIESILREDHNLEFSPKLSDLPTVLTKMV